MAHKRKSEKALIASGWRIWKQEYESPEQGGRAVGFLARNDLLFDGGASYAYEHCLWQETLIAPISAINGDAEGSPYPNPQSEEEAYHAFLDRVWESARLQKGGSK